MWEDAGGAEGDRARAFYQRFKRSRQTASWRTAGSEQGAAKADKRLIQAWRAPLITHTDTHTLTYIQERKKTWKDA